MTTANDVVECIDRLADDPCQGAVEYRMPLSGTGVSFPRCGKHWSQRLDREERYQRDYPDSPFPPSWFDPANAGESWEDD